MAKPELPKKLNVCLIARQFPIAGRASGFSFLRLIARGLAARGHKVTVLAAEHPQGRREIEQDGVKIYFLLEGRSGRVRRDPFPDLVKSKFVDLHITSPFHIVHSVDNAAIKISRFKSEYKVAVAYDVAATRLAELFAIMGMAQENLSSLIRTGLAVAYRFISAFRLDRRLLRTADGVFVSSPRERIALERYYLYPDLKIHTVPYGIEVGDLSPRERSEELRRSLGIPETAKVIVTITDMTEVEEVKNVLLAFEQVAIKKPTSRLIIIGDGPKFMEIEFQMLKLALGSRVIFTKAVRETELPDYIALADVFVNLSSRTTGFEPSLLEAMAQKKVIVGSEVSSMATIVEHSQDGFLVRPADVDELTALLLEIFTGQLPIEHIGEAARRKVLDLFDSEKMVVETLTSYYAILKGTGYYRAQGSIVSRLADFLFSFG
ncbi:MAG: glycosyltransferase family 4 protein [Bdellovibrionota bacterium]